MNLADKGIKSTKYIVVGLDKDNGKWESFWDVCWADSEEEAVEMYKATGCVKCKAYVEGIDFNRAAFHAAERLGDTARYYNSAGKKVGNDG